MLQGGPYNFIITCIFMMGCQLLLPPAQTGMAITWHLEGAAQSAALCVASACTNISSLSCSAPISWQAQTARLRQELSAWKGEFALADMTCDLCFSLN